MDYLTDRLSGYPPTQKIGYHTVQYGPLVIQATARSQFDVIGEKFGERMRTGEGSAYALIRRGKHAPDSTPMQVLMSLDSFTQLLQWAFAADPEMFTRQMKHRKDTDG